MNIFIATIRDNKAFLTEEESWHCAKVLRYEPGRHLGLIDGKGNFYEGTLHLVTPKSCIANIVKGPREQPQKNYYLHLAIAPTKQMERMEWMIEKAVEIGIDEISIIICHHSERTVVKTERVQKIIESAVKQSLQALIPKLNPLTDFNSFIATKAKGQKLIAHCFDSVKKNISEVEFKNQNTTVMIGPEGDFSQPEVDSATASGFESLSLGTNRLRTETAGLYVCQAASILSGIK